MVHVVVTLKGRLVGRFDVDGDRVRLGRHPDNEVQIDNKSVSRFHTQLSKDGQTGLWMVEDQGSFNGTFVNGARVKTKVLREGDAITVGQFTVSLQVESASASGAGASSSISFRSGVSPADREAQAPEKGYLEFMERSGQILLARDLCQLGSAPGLDVHLDGAPAKTILIVRGYGGFQLVNVSQGASRVFVDDVEIMDRTWLNDGAQVRVGGESFAFRIGLPGSDQGTMQIQIPKQFRPG